MPNYKCITIRKYAIINKQGKCIRETDDINLAQKLAAINNGIIYEQMKYKAIKRLQSIYYKKVVYNNADLSKLDYPNLLIKLN